MEKQLLSIPEFCETVGLGETLAKRLLRDGAVLSVKVGDRRLIPATAVREYVARLVAEAQPRQPSNPVAGRYPRERAASTRAALGAVSSSC